MNRNQIGKIALSLSLATALGLPTLVGAAEADTMGMTGTAVAVPAQDPKVAAELQKAADYEKLAQQQETVIQEHEKMKAEYVKSHDINEKRESLFKAMKAHCDAIIGDATKLKADYEAFAKWHRMYAAVLQGK